MMQRAHSHLRQIFPSLVLLVVLSVAIVALAGAREEGNEPAMKHSEVVFMYATDSEVYEAYRATFTAWGGGGGEDAVKRHHDLGMRCAGSMWCLTAGARRLHENPALHEAVVRDIEGNPVAVPWLFDHVHEGQETWFGCTNHPAFKEHLRDEVRRVMRGGADSLHVDDHLGTAQPADHMGGGLCDYCIEAFRNYLRDNASEDDLGKAGIDSLDDFDYRDLIREHATTREAYVQLQWEIPLMGMFIRFHREAAAENVRELHELAKEVTGEPVLLSANAWIGSERHHTIIPHLTHVICEVPQNAAAGTSDLRTAISTYETATRFDIPLAGTASGHDWAHVAETGQHELIRFWVGLAYAHGQRFMVPHRQWCFNEEKGTHWHTFPVEEFAPIYHFIRDNAGYFDGFEAVDNLEVEVPGNVLATVRKREDSIVMHVLNLAYSEEHDRMQIQENIQIALPVEALPEAEEAILLAHDADPVSIPLEIVDGEAILSLPELRGWTLVVLESR